MDGGKREVIQLTNENIQTTPLTVNDRDLIFVERNAKAIACVKQNLGAMSRSGGREPTEVQVVTADALTWVMPSGAEAADLVFIDPPYEMIPQAAPVLFAHLSVALAAKDAALVVFELPGERSLSPEGWTIVKRLGKGNHQPTVAILRRG